MLKQERISITVRALGCLMKKTILLAAILAGCQGTPIGDAMIGKEKLAQMDDQYCQSIGARKGSDAYIQCRLTKDTERERNHQAAYRRAGAGLAAAGASMQTSAAVNRQINCTSSRYGNQVYTNCY